MKTTNISFKYLLHLNEIIIFYKDPEVKKYDFKKELEVVLNYIKLEFPTDILKKVKLKKCK